MATLRCILVIPGVLIANQAFADPVRVFTLADQSNMEGKGAIKHLERRRTRGSRSLLTEGVGPSEFPSTFR